MYLEVYMYFTKIIFVYTVTYNISYSDTHITSHYCNIK